MNGTLSGGESLRGSLTVVPEVGGTLSLSGRLSGTIAVERGVDGALSVVGELSGSLAPAVVEYEGSYTVTPTDQSQTLPTSGKTMSQDVVVNAIAAPYIDTTIAEGAATAADIATGKQAYANGSLITGTASLWSPWGADAELIATYDMGTTALKDTGFNTWEPTTTATSIKATSILGTIHPSMMSSYEYVVKTVFESNTVYASGTTLKAAVVRQIFVIVQSIYRKPSSLSNMGNGVNDSNYCTTLHTAPFMEYYNTSGKHTMTWTGSYGIYPAATAATFSNTGALNPTITIKAPTYNARCYKSYFTETMAAAVDKTNSTIKCKVYVYRITGTRSTMYQIYHDIVDIYNA